jgi:hypothetical protein
MGKMYGCSADGRATRASPVRPRQRASTASLSISTPSRFGTSSGTMCKRRVKGRSARKRRRPARVSMAPCTHDDEEDWIRTLRRRIDSETEPPNLATETNTGRGVLPAPKSAVSGSDARGLDRQDPAESRRIPVHEPSTGGKSPPPQTEWRWWGSGGSVARGRKSLIGRESSRKSHEYASRLRSQVCD